MSFSHPRTGEGAYVKHRPCHGVVCPEPDAKMQFGIRSVYQGSAPIEGRHGAGGGRGWAVMRAQEQLSQPIGSLQLKRPIRKAMLWPRPLYPTACSPWKRATLGNVCSVARWSSTAEADPNGAGGMCQ